MPTSIEDIAANCRRYGIAAAAALAGTNRKALSKRLNRAGYNSSGHPIDKPPHEPLLRDAPVRRAPTPPPIIIYHDDPRAVAGIAPDGRPEQTRADYHAIVRRHQLAALNDRRAA